MARREHSLPLEEPCCVYDVIEAEGVDLRFVDIPSLEGMYVNGDPPRILVGAKRPAGRRRLTAAHELGHHKFGHGTSVDELYHADKAKTPEEMQADAFASFFLMPKSLVVSGFSRRGWEIPSASTEQVFTVAGWLGVGYSTLVSHLRMSLGLLSSHRAATLLAVPVKRVRARALGLAPLHDGFVVDEHWTGRPVDAAVGDILRIPKGALLEGSIGFAERDDRGSYVRLIAPGLGRLDTGTWAAFVRVTEREFVGRAIFRHLPRED